MNEIKTVILHEMLTNAENNVTAFIIHYRKEEYVISGCRILL